MILLFFYLSLKKMGQRVTKLYPLDYLGSLEYDLDGSQYRLLMVDNGNNESYLMKNSHTVLPSLEVPLKIKITELSVKYTPEGANTNIYADLYNHQGTLLHSHVNVSQLYEIHGSFQEQYTRKQNERTRLRDL